MAHTESGLEITDNRDAGGVATLGPSARGTPRSLTDPALSCCGAAAVVARPELGGFGENTGNPAGIEVQIRTRHGMLATRARKSRTRTRTRNLHPHPAEHASTYNNW